MSVIIILIIVSVLVAILFLAIFIWAVKSGQYDDTYSPSVRMLFDDKAQTTDKRAGKKASDKTEEKK